MGLTDIEPAQHDRRQNSVELSLCGSQGQAWLSPASLLMPGPPDAPTLGLALPRRLPALAPASSAAGSGETGIAEKPAGVSPVSRYLSASARPSLNACERDSNHRQDNTSLKDQHGIFTVLICRRLAAPISTAWTDAVLPIMVDDAAHCRLLKFCMPTLTLPFEGRSSVADVEGHEVALALKPGNVYVCNTCA